MDEFESFSKVFSEILSQQKIPLISISEIKIDLNYIGSGSQAKIYKAKFRNQIYALKTINREEIDFQSILHELAIVSKLKHENIPAFKGVIVTEMWVGYLIHLVEGNTLAFLLLKNFLTFEEKVQIVKQLSVILKFLHESKICHRDIKPENIMIETFTNKVYLIDFGIAKVMTNEKYITKAKGTLYYIAPEVFDSDKIDKIIDCEEIVSVITTKIDVWSFGCLVSHMFSGVIPWCNLYNMKSIQKALVKKCEFPIPKEINNKKIRDVIRKSTIIDRNKRAYMDEIDKLVQNI